MSPCSLLTPRKLFSLNSGAWSGFGFDFGYCAGKPNQSNECALARDAPFPTCASRDVELIVAAALHHVHNLYSILCFPGTLSKMLSKKKGCCHLQRMLKFACSARSWNETWSAILFFCASFWSQCRTYIYLFFLPSFCKLSRQHFLQSYTDQFLKVVFCWFGFMTYSLHLHWAACRLRFTILTPETSHLPAESGKTFSFTLPSSSRPLGIRLPLQTILLFQNSSAQKLPSSKVTIQWHHRRFPYIARCSLAELLPNRRHVCADSGLAFCKLLFLVPSSGSPFTWASRVKEISFCKEAVMLSLSVLSTKWTLSAK